MKILKSIAIGLAVGLAVGLTVGIVTWVVGTLADLRTYGKPGQKYREDEKEIERRERAAARRLVEDKGMRSVVLICMLQCDLLPNTDAAMQQFDRFWEHVRRKAGR